MKWLLFVGLLTAIASLGGCCQPGGLFSSSGSYGSYSSPAPYYAAPAAATNPCACQ